MSRVTNEKLVEAIQALEAVGFQVLGIERSYNPNVVGEESEEKLIRVVLKPESPREAGENNREGA